MGINLLITILFCLVIMVRVKKWTEKDIYKSYGYKSEERSEQVELFFASIFVMLINIVYCLIYLITQDV